MTVLIALPSGLGNWQKELVNCIPAAEKEPNISKGNIHELISIQALHWA
jgi:hypothetical protein